MEKKIEQIQKLISKKPSSWKEKAKARLNKPWLNEYSSQIALRIFAIIETDPELNQTRLAKVLGVERQQISKILKGQENLTLESIYKLSKALNFELISFPDYKYNQKRATTYKSNAAIEEIENKDVVKAQKTSEKKANTNELSIIAPMKNYKMVG